MKRVVLLVIVVVLVILFLILKPNSKGIPKIIHQTAPDDKSKWPAVWYKCQESWKRNYPDYEYRMWSDADLDNLIKEKFPEYLHLYMSYPRNIHKIDVARYFILYEYGGIYADMDFECIRPFMDRIDDSKVNVAESQHLEETGEELQNALMISPEKHPFWLEVFKDLPEHTDDDTRGLGPVWTTGPYVIIRTNNANPGLMHALPRDNFSPKTETYARAGRETFTDDRRADPNIFTVHHGTCAWGEL
jgi:mannosyltransferase OCH1-like enzyme